MSIKQILNEALLSYHIKERLISRFIDRKEYSVGYELHNRRGEYKIIGTYTLPTEFKNNLINSLNYVVGKDFPPEKSYGIKIGEININKHNVRFVEEGSINEIKDKTLVIVDQDTNSNGNVVYLIIRNNKIISIYFAKSYVKQTPEKLRVDAIIDSSNETLNEYKLYGNNDTRLKAWDKLIKSVENKFKIKLDYFFGGGSYGIVFDIGDNKLVKLTTDNEEYETAKKLKGKHNEYLADIYEVYKFKEFPSTKIIFLEKLEEIPNMIKNDYIDLENMISSPQNGHMMVSELLKDVVWRNKNNKDWFLEFLEEKYSKNTMFLKLYNDLKKIYQEGINNKILIDDIHTDNLGYKNGHIAAFDVRTK